MYVDWRVLAELVRLRNDKVAIILRCFICGKGVVGLKIINRMKNEDWIAPDKI